MTKKLKNHNINNENNKVQYNWKKVSWNFELILFQIIKTHLEWLPQKISLIFIQRYPYLGLNTSQIKHQF
jgi:hypothetical protein